MQKKQEKVPDKPKKKEQPNKQKPKVKKRTPTRTYKSTRAADRINAVERASRMLIQMGYPNDRGNSLIIVPRLKLMLAFDSLDMDDSLRKEVKVSGYTLFHVSPICFETKKDLQAVLSTATKLEREEEVKPKKIRRLKKLSKPLDRNLGRV